GYRFRKFARRNKAAIAVAGLVLFFLVLLGSGAGWAMRDRDAREQEVARDRAAREAKVAGQVELIFTEVDRLEREQKWPEPLAAALDDWVYARPLVSERDVAGWKRLVAVVRGIDPEPLRDRVRATWGRPVSEVQGEVRRLADSIDIRAQHPATLVILARNLR